MWRLGRRTPTPKSVLLLCSYVSLGKSYNLSNFLICKTGVTELPPLSRNEDRDHICEMARTEQFPKQTSDNQHY